MAFNYDNFIDLIKAAVKNNASDVHIRTDEPPCFRIKGDLLTVQSKKLQLSDVLNIAKIVSKNADEKLIIDDNFSDFDGGYSLEGLCRLRFNILKYQGQLGIILRIIKEEIPDIEDLGLSPALKDICRFKNGLVLITGATGSGKTTTLASMIDQINKTRQCHIISIEDPVEFLHRPIHSRITQRELGYDVKDYNLALRSALRQDPDIIFIGEMRDAETASMALRASETGHVVFATIHTTDAMTTIGRVISLFSPEEQDEARKRIAACLMATISQRMMPRADDSGMIVGQEIMISSPGIRECILGKDDLYNIYTYITKGHGKAGTGSQSFDQHIRQL